jgi:hypothetical protein
MASLVDTLSTAEIWLVTCLELLLFVLVIRKRVYRTLIFFAVYIFLLVPRDMAWLYISHTQYLWKIWASYFYYISDAVLNFTRLLVIVEIGIRTLRGYPAVWHYVWRVLALIGSALVVWGTFEAIKRAHPTHQLILTIQSLLNGTQALMLLVILAIGLYYRVDVPRLFRSIVIGICIYSAVQIVNSEFGRYVANPTYSPFDLIQRYSVTIMELIWVWALWKWSGTPPQTLQRIPQEQYDDLSPHIHDRLRELNDRLSRMKKQR